MWVGGGGEGRSVSVRRMASSTNVINFPLNLKRLTIEKSWEFVLFFHLNGSFFEENIP